MKRPYKRKLTLWFNGEKYKPIYVGPYQVSEKTAHHKRGSAILYAYWDGFLWGLAARTAEQAVMFKERKANKPFQNRAWRGRTAP